MTIQEESLDFGLSSPVIAIFCCFPHYYHQADNAKSFQPFESCPWQIFPQDCWFLVAAMEVKTILSMLKTSKVENKMLSKQCVDASDWISSSSSSSFLPILDRLPRLKKSYKLLLVMVNLILRWRKSIMIFLLDSCHFCIQMSAVLKAMMMMMKKGKNASEFEHRFALLTWRAQKCQRIDSFECLRFWSKKVVEVINRWLVLG